jgi:ADP-ribose pyrophosphatase YjhB (NUDIX family)
MAKPIVVVANVILDKQGRMLIGKHKNGHKAELYAFPGGKLEDETLDECFWRELKEETGLNKPWSDAKPRFLGISEQAFKEKRFLILFFYHPYITRLMGIPQTLEPGKHYGWEWLTFEEIRDKPLAGSIKDFLSWFSLKDLKHGNVNSISE